MTGSKLLHSVMTYKHANTCLTSLYLCGTITESFLNPGAQSSFRLLMLHPLQTVRERLQRQRRKQDSAKYVDVTICFLRLKKMALPLHGQRAPHTLLADCASIITRVYLERTQLRERLDPHGREVPML